MDASSSVWKNPQKIMEALITKTEEYNAKMLHKRFEFLTKSYSRLVSVLPDSLKVFETQINSRKLFAMLLRISFSEHFSNQIKTIQFLYANRNFVGIFLRR